MIKNGDKLYVITRQDMPSGVQATQAIHAGIEFQYQNPEIARTWFHYSSYIALLSVLNEEALKQLIEKAQLKEIKLSIYREPDLDNSITAIALEPSIQAKKLCSSIPLALKDK